MREALAPLLSKHGATLEVIDVDDRRDLEERWGDKVPVLLAGERELCHYHLDRAALAAWLAGTSRTN
jgi:thioredoxin reductase (NADPH)